MTDYDPDKNVFGRVEQGCIPQVMWHITDVCPLGCPFCFAPKTTSSVDLTSASILAKKLKLLGVAKVDIAGGEPLVHRHLPELVKLVRETDLHQTLTTSGVGSKPNRRFIIDNIKVFVRTIFSVDAPESAMHDELRVFPGAWKQAMSLLEQLPLEERKRSVRINTVVTTPFVTNRWCEPMAEVITALGVREWCLIQPHPANEKVLFSEYAVDDTCFESEVERARLLARGIAVLSRPAHLYSTYWVLYPDNILSQHTASSSRGLEFNLLTTPADEVRRAIRDATSSAPTA